MSEKPIGVFIGEEGDAQISRVSKILAGIPQGLYKAVGSAFKRAATSGLAMGARAVTKEYAISQSELKRNVKRVSHFRQDGGTVEAVFGFRGNVIPIIRFDTTYARDGHVQTRVKRGGTKQQLDNAFVAQMGGHTGVYERLTSKRYPVKELYGPSAPQMMYSNEAVYDMIEEKVQSTYDNRIEHEITRILNGWECSA